MEALVAEAVQAEEGLGGDQAAMINPGGSIRTIWLKALLAEIISPPKPPIS